MQPCIQEKRLEKLEKLSQKSNDNDILQSEQIKNMNEKLDTLNKTMTDFIKEIKENYVSNDKFNNLSVQVKDHKNTITWLSKGIIWWLLTMVIWLIIYIWQIFIK